MNQEQHFSSKSEQFFQLLKNVQFPHVHSFNASKFDYLFDIPETKQFFDWFLLNINENCFLSKQELDEFCVKASKGQIIWNLGKLSEINNLMNSKMSLENAQNNKEDISADCCSSLESLKRDLKFKEQELKHLSEQYELSQYVNMNLSENLFELKNRQALHSNQIQKLNEKESLVKNSCKMLNQNLSKSFIEFQMKFGQNSEEDNNNRQQQQQQNSSVYDNNNTNAINDSLLENYLTSEKSLLAKLQTLSVVEIDCVSFRNKFNKEKLDQLIASDFDFDKKTFKCSEMELINWIMNEMNKSKENKNIEETIKLIAQK
jgi:hypothetical protein